MQEGGYKLARALDQVMAAIKPGVATIELDQLAEKLVLAAGGQPSFKTVRNYKWTTCINVDSGVVHGIPGKYQIHPGDVVSVDVGILYKGFHTDMAKSVVVPGSTNREQENLNLFFLQVGKETLKKAIAAAKPGNRVGHISQIIERELTRANFSPIKALTGHGVGKTLHEDPLIPGYLRGRLENTPILKEGMILAIEIIYSQGGPDVVIAPDGWTIESADGKITGLFEDTIAVRKGGPLVLTA